ncbi:MAG: hypothetical protein Q8K85_25370, partial [Hyphomicrobium sp.]|nr:hypothetical protein [Hyphomicrobium sp.]
MTLRRADEKDQAPMATPALDPVSVLRQRGEARPAAGQNRAAPLRPPPAPMFAAPTPPGGPMDSLPPARSGEDELAEFWKTLGIDATQLDAARRAANLQILAAAIREAVGGLVEVLSARTAIKDEFRMDQTRLQPQENNPLKFFRSGEEALRRGLADRPAGFLALDVATRLGFGDIKAHEVATMTAMQNAILQLFQRLAPVAIEQAAGPS